MSPSDYCERCDLPLAMCQHGRWRAVPGPSGRLAAEFLQELLDDGLLPVPRMDWKALWAWYQEHREEADLRSAGLGPLITARYSGTCAACAERWSPGDLIRASDEDGGWLCQRCGRD